MANEHHASRPPKVYRHRRPKPKKKRDNEYAYPYKHAIKKLVASAGCSMRCPFPVVRAHGFTLRPIKNARCSCADDTRRQGIIKLLRLFFAPLRYHDHTTITLLVRRANPFVIFSCTKAQTLNLCYYLRSLNSPSPAKRSAQNTTRRTSTRHLHMPTRIILCMYIPQFFFMHTTSVTARRPRPPAPAKVK